MQAKLLKRLRRVNGRQNSLTGWKQLLGVDFEEVYPLLEKVTGECVTTYPCPCSGASLMICEKDCGDGYIAFASGEDAGCDEEDLTLSWDDVQAWRLGTEKVAAICSGHSTRMRQQDVETEQISNADLKSEIQKGFQSVKRERIQDEIRQTQQRETICELAKGPAEFLAGIATKAKLTTIQKQTFLDLTEYIIDGEGKRVRSYSEIATMRGLKNKQVVGKRATALYAKHEGIKDYVDSIRKKPNNELFSEMGASRRRKAGVDEAYGYDN